MLSFVSSHVQQGSPAAMEVQTLTMLVYLAQPNGVERGQCTYWKAQNLYCKYKQSCLWNKTPQLCACILVKRGKGINSPEFFRDLKTCLGCTLPLSRSSFEWLQKYGLRWSIYLIKKTQNPSIILWVKKTNCGAIHAFYWTIKISAKTLAVCPKGVLPSYGKHKGAMCSGKTKHLI